MRRCSALRQSLTLYLPWHKTDITRDKQPGGNTREWSHSFLASVNALADRTVSGHFGELSVVGTWESGSRALRNPVYLDMESLLAQAESNDIEVPVASDIVERSVNQREGSAKQSYGILGVGGSKCSEVEYQSNCA